MSGKYQDTRNKYSSHRRSYSSSKHHISQKTDNDHQQHRNVGNHSSQKPVHRSQSVRNDSHTNKKQDHSNNIFANSTYNNHHFNQSQSKNDNSQKITNYDSNNSHPKKHLHVNNDNEQVSTNFQFSRSLKDISSKHKLIDDENLYKDISRTQVQPKLRSNHNTTIDLTTQEGRKKVADETVQILKTGKYKCKNSYGKIEEVDISTKIFNCEYGSTTYKPHYYTYFTLPPKGHMCKIEVKPESTFGAARRFFAMKYKTCVLNFASATKPGGGFKNGKKAQEESLSRQSALYVSLLKQKEMYQYHLANKHDNVYKDYLIYSASVPVFRDDKTEQLLPKDQVFLTDVITSAAPWKAKIQESGGDVSTLDKIIAKRCEKILKCAIDNKVEALVLGAYGCGVFGNKPKDISHIFKELLIDKEYGKFFKVVDFAITGKTSENFIEFASTFRPYMS